MGRLGGTRLKRSRSSRSIEIFSRAGEAGFVRHACSVPLLRTVIALSAAHEMSLYYDAATVLTSEVSGGSFKSRIYGNKLDLKSKPAHLYALISETAKFDLFLKEVIDNADFLAQEPKVRKSSTCNFGVPAD